MKTSAEPLSQILKRALKKSHLQKMNEAAIKMGWDGFVGKDVARHTVPGFLKKGCLFVRVDSPVWAYELSTHLKETMIKKINEGLGEIVINDIHFHVK